MFEKLTALLGHHDYRAAMVRARRPIAPNCLRPERALTGCGSDYRHREQDDGGDQRGCQAQWVQYAMRYLSFTSARRGGARSRPSGQQHRHRAAIFLVFRAVLGREIVLLELDRQ